MVFQVLASNFSASRDIGNPASLGVSYDRTGHFGVLKSLVRVLVVV